MARRYSILDLNNMALSNMLISYVASLTNLRALTQFWAYNHVLNVKNRLFTRWLNVYLMRLVVFSPPGAGVVLLC